MEKQITLEDQINKLKILAPAWISHMNKISDDIRTAEDILRSINAPSVNIEITMENNIVFLWYFRNRLALQENERSPFVPVIELPFTKRECCHQYLPELLKAVNAKIKERI